MHDQRAIQRSARRNTEVCGELGDRANPLDRNDVSAVRVAARTDFRRDAAHLERMRVDMLVGDETADARDPHQYSLVAQFAQGPVGRHPRDAEGPDNVIFRRHARRGGPFARTDVVENMAFDLQIQGLDRCSGFAHGRQVKLYRQL